MAARHRSTLRQLGTRPFRSLSVLAICTFFVIAVPNHGDAAAAKAELVLDIPALVGKTAAEVDAILGKPSEIQAASCRGTPCPRHLYRGGKIEVVFVRGKADWITVFPDNLPYRKESLTGLGLPLKSPTFSNAEHMRWEGALLGYKEVALFAGERLSSGGTKVWYAYTYASTVP